jgi:hypothetical protein
MRKTQKNVEPRAGEYQEDNKDLRLKFFLRIRTTLDDCSGCH